MYLNNQAYARLVIASIILLILLLICKIGLGINDLFYLNKIVSGKGVMQDEQDFFMQKNIIVKRVSSISTYLYLVSFVIWLYRAYHNVYIKEPKQAPFKRAIVPFTLIIPILNFYAPFQIMKFI